MPLRRMILKDTIRIVEFYLEAVPTLSFELAEYIEHALLWQYRHKARPGPNDAALRTSRSCHICGDRLIHGPWI